MSAAEPRALAWKALMRVETQQAFANLALDAELSRSPSLEPRDRALATELTYGVLRRRLALDRALAPWVRGGLDGLEPGVRELLRLGAYQLLHTRIPPHAAVGETVATAKTVGLRRAAGLINAVLRRVAEKGAPPSPDFDEDPAGWLEVEGSLPQWLAQRLLDRLGAEEARAFVEAIAKPAPNTVRINRSRTTREEAKERLAAELPDATISEGKLSPDALLVEGGGLVARSDAYREGLVSPQDEAAQLVGHLASPKAGSRVLDACAAPGGKACHLAEMGAGEVVAMDIHARKARRIAAEAERLGLSAVRSQQGDATGELPDGPFDLILLDAPCTALGTLQRHPELRYRRNPDDVARMVATQRAMLANVAEALRPGDVLVYAVCSILPEEGPEQIERFLREQGGRFAPAPPPTPFEWLSDGHRLETWPQRQGMDGFFAARLQRIR